MSLRDVFRLSPATPATPPTALNMPVASAVTATKPGSASRRLAENIAGMLGLTDWKTKLTSINEKLDAAIAERDALAAKRQARALAASEDAAAEKELADIEKKHRAVELTIERLQLAVAEAKRHSADEAQAERLRAQQAAVKLGTKSAEKLHKTLANVQAAVDALQRELAAMTEDMDELRKYTGEHNIIAEMETKIVHSIKDQLAVVCGGFSRCEAIPYNKRGDLKQYAVPVEYFAKAAASYFDKQ